MSAEVRPGGVLDGKYLLLAALGGGRFGTVYRATHIALQKPVAVKVLHAGDRLAARDFEQFRVEAEALGRLSHPNIVGVTDFGVDPSGGGTPYLVMELVDGPTLEEVAREGPIDVTRAAPWIVQVAAALDHARASGVAHGDLSAANVVLVGLGQGAVAKVIDFGLAHLVDVAREEPSAHEASSFDLATRFAGTPAYTAPERLRGAAPSAEADVYALAVLTYRLITGRYPFEGDTPSVLQAQLTRPAPRPSAACDGLPASVDEAVASGLAKRSSDRPASAGAFAALLLDAARHVARARWRRREAPRRVGLSLGLALGLTAAGPWLASLDFVERLEGGAMDVRFALSDARPPDPRLLLVSIDDDSLAADATPLPERGEEFAASLDRAVRSGAAVVAFDLLLPEAWARARRFGDFVLAHADRLVLGMASDGERVVGPEVIDPLVAGALGPEATSRVFGLVTHVPAPDGVVRRARTVVPDREGRPRPTLAGRVHAIAEGVREPGAGSEGEFLVDYGINASDIERIGWRRFAEATAEGARYDGRILLVGAEFTGSGDRHRVPGPGRLSAEVSGLALQGVIADTLLSGRSLRDAQGGWAWSAAGAALFGTALSFLWSRRPLAASATATGLFVGLTAATLLVFRAGHAMPYAAPALLWVAATGVAVALRFKLPAPPE